jgi:hypothetical protein
MNHTGERPFTCPHDNCGLTFVTNTHLKRHLNVHQKPKPFECPEAGCGAAFAKHLQLKKHLFIHTGFFAFRCEVEGCGQSFKSTTQLSNHAKLHSGKFSLSLVEWLGGDGLTPFPLSANPVLLDEIKYFCNREGCTEGFTTWSKLNDHKRTHRGASNKIRLGASKENLVARLVVAPKSRTQSRQEADVVDAEQPSQEADDVQRPDPRLDDPALLS